MEQELLTAEMMAKRLHVRPETVREWGRRGVIPKVQFSRKVIRFDPAAVTKSRTHKENKKSE
ncbi:MAG: hypothetical protein KAV82_01865 [Phycisphaerae bacterium]|nr:hypothetical protein [Phycisphaerae bacterium]